MATLTNVQIFTRIGIAPAAARNAIIDDFLSEGLEGLLHMSDEETHVQAMRRWSVSNHFDTNSEAEIESFGPVG